MATYDAGQIIGRTLYAKSSVDLKRLPQDSAPTVFTVDPGKMVGVVDTYVGPNANTGGSLWWAFKDNSGRYYYAKHNTGKFSTSALQDQGALTVQQQAQAQADKDKTTTDKITDVIKWVAIVAALAYIGKGFIQSRSK